MIEKMAETVGAAQLEKDAKDLVTEFCTTLEETDPREIFVHFEEGSQRNMRSVSFMMSLAILTLETLEEESRDPVARALARATLQRIDQEAEREAAGATA